MAQQVPQELFAVFHPDTENDRREPGVVIVRETKDWAGVLASMGNPKTGPVDFSVQSVLVVTGQFLGEFCRNTAIKGVARAGDGSVKVMVEETYPEKCPEGVVCRCSLAAGMPPPIGKSVIALRVEKPVAQAGVETVSVIKKCCPPK